MRDGQVRVRRGRVFAEQVDAELSKSSARKCFGNIRYALAGLKRAHCLELQPPFLQRLWGPMRVFAVRLGLPHVGR